MRNRTEIENRMRWSNLHLMGLLKGERIAKAGKKAIFKENMSKNFRINKRYKSQAGTVAHTCNPTCDPSAVGGRGR